MQSAQFKAVRSLNEGVEVEMMKNKWSLRHILRVDPKRLVLGKREE